MHAPLGTVERFPQTATDARKVANAMLLEVDWGTLIEYECRASD
jgi:hypothetical protein